MTINVQLDDELLRQVQAYAERTGLDVHAVVEESLRERFIVEQKMDSPRKTKGEEGDALVPARDLRPKSGVDLSNMTELRDRMDFSDPKFRKFYGLD